MRYAQIILGPAGSGKSTYCTALIRHLEASQRIGNVVNLDPAAERFHYEDRLVADIRELISLDDVMEDEELHLGPNGGLVFAMEYLISNQDWLEEALGDTDNDYVLFDLPGQIEIHTHFDIVRRLVTMLERLNFRVVGIFCLDSNFVTDISKYISGIMVSLSTMINLEIPFINLLTKCDLLTRSQRRKIWHLLEPDANSLLESEDIPIRAGSAGAGADTISGRWGARHAALTKAIASVVDDHALVKFTPLNIQSENSLNDVLLLVDNALQWAEDQDVRVQDFDGPEQEMIDNGAYG